MPVWHLFAQNSLKPSLFIHAGEFHADLEIPDFIQFELTYQIIDRLLAMILVHFTQHHLDCIAVIAATQGDVHCQ